MLHARRYKDIAQTTASPERLMVLLLRAALSSMEIVHAGFCKPGVLPAKKVSGALVKAQDIVFELQATLDQRRAPALCAALDDVYAFVSWRLIKARKTRDPVDIAAAIRCFSPIVHAFETAVGGSDAGR